MRKMRPGHSAENNKIDVELQPLKSGVDGDNNNQIDHDEKKKSPTDNQSVVKKDLNAADGQSVAQIFLSPINNLNSRGRFGLVGLCLITTFLVSHIAVTISQDKAIFPAGALTGGQIAGFWVCLASMLWWLGVHAAVYKDILLDGESYHNAVSKWMTEEQYGQLSGAAEFCFYIMMFYFCDRTTYIPRAKKHYDPDTFWTLWILLCVGGLMTLRKAKKPAAAAPVAASSKKSSDGSTPVVAGENKENALALAAAEAVKSTTTADSTVAVNVTPSAPQVEQVKDENESYHIKHLQRDQTEEWKGWMQVMFLWYHYFNAKDIYNAIRLYIAAYVWMTGFGNFSYYYIRRDFSFARFCQMQWRLNFMVVLTCAVLGNEYMLYYICMLHTTFTLIIYAILGFQNQMNNTFNGVCFKFAVCIVFAAVMWDIDGVFDMVWAPLTWLVQYHDPYNTKRPIMHEWQFRSHLDHLVWIVGMWMAYNHPRFDSWLEAIDKMPHRVANTIKCSVFALCIFGFYMYNEMVFSLPKKEYNKLHAYTSFIPIILFIIMRNIFTTARAYHMHLFEFLGKTTLETYIAQFHIWMATTGPNGAPKKLLRILPEKWPLINFMVMSVIFFFVSYRLFQTTNTVKGFVLPAKVPNIILQRNVAYLTAAVLVVYMTSLTIQSYIGNLGSVQ